MYETMRDAIRRLLMLAVLSIAVAGCGTGEGPKSTVAVCTTNSDLSFGSPKYLLSMNMAELTVSDSCAALESVSVKLTDGTETINLAVTLDAFGDATVDVNFGTTNAASNTINVVLGDTLTASFTDSGGNPRQDTTQITDVLAAGVYSETNTVPALPVADIITRRPGGKITTVDTQSQAVTLYDGFYVLEVDYDSSAAGGDFNGIVFEFGPARLKNDSFERPDTSGGDVGCSQDWNCFNTSFTASNNFNPGTSPVAHTGTQILKQFGADGGTQQSMAVEPGDTVTASAYALNWTGDAFNNLALLQLAFFDAGDNQIGTLETFADTTGDQSYQLSPQDGDSPDDWTLMEISGTAPAGSVRANLLLLHILTPPQPPGGSIFWDDARLTIEPGATGEDLSVYEFLRFAVETASLSGISDLTIELEDVTGATASVFLSAYSATASADVSGWSTVEIPLADFTGLDMSAITSLGFLDASSSPGSPATLTDASLYFDDINFAIGAAVPPLAAPTSTGVLINSPIEGVSFSTNTQSGVTNAAGEFEYIDGESVTFSIGGITLGTVAGRAVVSPVELTGSLEPTDQAAINMLVFLQSIDADQDSSNGIQVSAFTQTAAASASLNFNLSAGAFASAVTSVVNAITEPDNPIVSEMDALDNFYATYVSLGGTQTFDWLFPGYDPVGEAGFELVWSDEFNSGTAPSDYWNRETGYGNNGWGNDEWQEYTADPANLSVAGGVLNISARCDTAPDCNKRDGTITSARINTSGNFEFKYGKVSARIKAPTGNGAWSAFWMLGANFPTVGWPFSGEIDITEIAPLTIGTDTTQFAIHWCDETNPNVTPGDCFPEGRIFVTDALNIGEDIGDDFHVFEAVWDENGITGLIDGTEYFFRAIDPGTMDEFLKEFFLILNVAIGGDLGGAPDATTDWPQTMLVDWVRVYQPTGGNGTSTINPPASTVSGITTTLEASASSAVADGNPTVTITVQAKDPSGYDIGSSAGSVVLSASGSASLGAVNDNGDGSYTATLGNLVAEQVTVTGTIGGQPISASATVDFVPGPVSVSTTTISANPGTVESDGVSSSLITVQAKDAAGNDIGSDVGIVTLSASGSAVIGPVSFSGNGQYTASVINTVAEPVIISGQIDGFGISDTASVTFTVGAVSGAQTTIDAAPASVTADGVSDSTVTVQAKDVNGNDITSDVGTVILQSDGSASVGAVSYAGNGQYTADVTSTVAEQVIITGSIAGNPISDSASITFLPGPVSGLGTTIDASPATAVNNGLSRAVIVVQAADVNGNAITTGGATVVLNASGSAALSGVSDNNDGSYTATVTNTVEETVTISGTVNGAAITDSAQVGFEPAVGLYSDSSTTTVLAYTEIIETTTGCNLTTVTPLDNAGLALEGAGLLQADYSGGGNGCNGFAFNFLKPVSSTSTVEYGPQDFDGLNAAAPDAISNEGFFVTGYGFNTDSTIEIYWYGSLFPAPNGGPAFSAIASGEGDGGTSDQYLNIYNDYANPDHTNIDRRIHGFVLQEHVICATNTGASSLPNDCESKPASDFDTNGLYRFSFSAKAPADTDPDPNNWTGIGTSPVAPDGSGGEPGQFAEHKAFIKTLDPDAGYATTNELVMQMTDLVTGVAVVDNLTWTTYSIDLNVTDIDALDGQILQFGWETRAGNYQNTGVFYDDIGFLIAPVDVSANSALSFAVNASLAPSLVDLEVRLADAVGGNGSVNLIDHAPSFSEGDWDVYVIPLADFGIAVDLAQLKSVGFYNASSSPLDTSVTLITETLYFDDIHLVK